MCLKSISNQHCPPKVYDTPQQGFKVCVVNTQNTFVGPFRPYFLFKYDEWLEDNTCKNLTVELPTDAAELFAWAADPQRQSYQTGFHIYKNEADAVNLKMTLERREAICCSYVPYSVPRRIVVMPVQYNDVTAEGIDVTGYDTVVARKIMICRAKNDQQ